MSVRALSLVIKRVLPLNFNISVRSYIERLVSKLICLAIHLQGNTKYIYYIVVGLCVCVRVYDGGGGNRLIRILFISNKIEGDTTRFLSIGYLAFTAHLYGRTKEFHYSMICEGKFFAVHLNDDDVI